MNFSADVFEKLLFSSPTQLPTSEKNRLLQGLKPFMRSEPFAINEGKARSPKPDDFKYTYNNFYLQKPQLPIYLLQGDIIPRVSYPYWDKVGDNFQKRYIMSIALSNTCDMEIQNNQRKLNKNLLFAPCIDFNSYCNALIGDSKQTIIENIKTQQYSNLFYVPPFPGDANEGYVIAFDEIFSFPYEKYKNIANAIVQSRKVVLDNIGYYLLLLKLSFHMLRLPEPQDRTSV